MKNTLLLAAAFAAAVSTTAVAQVQVIDSSPQSAGTSVRSNSAPANPVQSADVNPQAELFYQLQTLQQEVMNLRGLVEEQAFEIKRLKQQRLDDYLNLDQRISALSGGQGAGLNSSMPALAGSTDANGTDMGASAANPAGSNWGADSATSATANPSVNNAAGNAGAPITPSAVTSSPTVTDASEADVYGAAYDLLKQRQIDASIQAFKDHLQAYPRGEYASNSYYWLGEIYLLKDNLPEAQRWFGDLLAEFPDSRKVPDAQFKLGKVYHLQGNTTRAQELLNIVAASNADASRLAQRYLQDNF